MDELYAKIENPDEVPLVLDGESDIQKFYAGQVVFLTGCTGFMGKCVVEKLLRSCPDLKKLYLLVRPKKEWTVEQRMTRYFQNVVFDKLRDTTSDFRGKVVAFEGDLTTKGLGLSPEDREILVQETNIILHNAATVRFNERLSTALRINVLGVKAMLDLGRECENIEVFMYVSTAYSNPYMKQTEEKFYPAPADMNVVHDLIAADENLNGMSEEALQIALGEWPNTYTFTKAVAEGIIKEESQGVQFPIGIFRPSIVISTYREPIKGWCGNLNGPVLGFIAFALGVVHAILAFPDDVMDVIPVDMCANALLATSWDVAINRKDRQEPTIYHYGTSTVKPTNLIQIKIDMVEAGIDKPSIRGIWYHFTIFTQKYWLWYLLDKLIHFLPAVIADLVLLLQGKKPLVVSTYLKINALMDQTMHFTGGRWQFDMTETRRMWDRMNMIDSDLFFCDIRNFEWDDYALTYWSGLRVYSMKEPMDNLEKARRRTALLRILHYVVITCLALLTLYVMGTAALCFVHILSPID